MWSDKIISNRFLECFFQFYGDDQLRGVFKSFLLDLWKVEDQSGNDFWVSDAGILEEKRMTG